MVNKLSKGQQKTSSKDLDSCTNTGFIRVIIFYCYVGRKGEYEDVVGMVSARRWPGGILEQRSTQPRGVRIGP